MYDNYDRWKMKERRQEELLRKRPVCVLCGEPIATEQFCDFPRLGCVCEDCIADHMQDVEVYQEEGLFCAN